LNLFSGYIKSTAKDLKDGFAYTMLTSTKGKIIKFIQYSSKSFVN